MNTILKNIKSIFYVSVLLSCSTIYAKPEACTGISKKCTEDVVYDKTIGGKKYSCYDCKQALCKGGGGGGLAGTAKTSVCTEKATTFTPISEDGQYKGGVNKLAPTSSSSSRNKLKSRFGAQLKLKPVPPKKSTTAPARNLGSNTRSSTNLKTVMPVFKKLKIKKKGAGDKKIIKLPEDGDNNKHLQQQKSIKPKKLRKSNKETRK